MNRSRVVLIAAAFVLLPLAAAGAKGAGGLTWGQEVLDPTLSSANLSSTVAGAYGYGVNYAGRRTGGFALAIRSDSASPTVEGGFVGGIAGQEFRQYPLLMAVNLWAGVGGLTAGRGVPPEGSFAVFGELTAEIGFTAIPGMLVTGYAGMQAMSAVSSSETFFSRAMYCPVVGVRVAWGS
jgi:hypothetical protein